VVGVRLLEDGVAEDNFFELLDGGSAMGSPDKWAVLLGEFSERFGNISKTANKGVLVPKDTKCALDLLY
jgi:hypothetical protein